MTELTNAVTGGAKGREAQEPARRTKGEGVDMRQESPEAEGIDDPLQVADQIETTGRSLPHMISRHCLAHRSGSPIWLGLSAYLAAACVTIVPLYTTALLDLPTLTTPSGSLKLPFLWDWNVHFMFAISLPLMTAFTVTDQLILIRALRKIIKGRVLLLLAGVQEVVDLWNRRFQRINVLTQAIGVIVGIIVACWNHATYVPPDVGYWAAKDWHFTVTGWVYLFCVGLFYWIVSVFVLRTIAISVFLWAIMNHARTRLVPFHPDRCGGIRPMGTLGLRNEYVLSLVGINLLVLWVVYHRALTTMPSSIDSLVIVAAIAYIVLGPIVFLMPMFPFREAMHLNRDELMNEVAERLRSELDTVRSKLRGEQAFAKNEEAIERLTKLGTLCEKLPVWPFDAHTLKKFAVAYLVPLVTTPVIGLINNLSLSRILSLLFPGH